MTVWDGQLSDPDKLERRLRPIRGRTDGAGARLLDLLSALYDASRRVDAAAGDILMDSSTFGHTLKQLSDVLVILDDELGEDQ